MDGIGNARRAWLYGSVVGTDQLRFRVTGTSLKLSGDEGTDRHQRDRLTAIRTVARHGRHLRLQCVDSTPHPSLL
jgi:hypothetical protein